MRTFGLIRDQRGVTVVELLVAVLLLGVALIGLAASFPYALIGLAAGGFQTTATLLAQERIDEAKNMGWSQLCTMVETDQPISVDVGGTVTDFPGFTRTTAVEAVPPSGATPNCSGAAPTGVTAAVVRVTVTFDPIYQTTVSTVMAQ